MLQFRAGNLHPAGFTNRGMGNITIASNLVTRVDNYHPFAEFIGEHPSDFP